MNPRLRYATRASDWTSETCYNCGDAIRRSTVICLNDSARVDSDYSAEQFVPRFSGLEALIYTEICHCTFTTHPGKEPAERLREEPKKSCYTTKPTLALITTRTTSKSCKDCKKRTQTITVSCLGRQAQREYQDRAQQYYPNREDASSKTYILVCTCRFTFNPFAKSDPPTATESESE
jgi:hypothetical protein